MITVIVISVLLGSLFLYINIKAALRFRRRIREIQKDDKDA